MRPIAQPHLDSTRETQLLLRRAIFLYQKIVRQDLAGGSVRQVVFLADEDHLHPRARGVNDLVLSQDGTIYPASAEQQRHHQE